MLRSWLCKGIHKTKDDAHIRAILTNFTVYEPGSAAYTVEFDGDYECRWFKNDEMKWMVSSKKELERDE